MTITRSLADWAEEHICQHTLQKKKSLLFPLLVALSYGYRFAVFWRHCFFDIGLLPTRSVSKPVISIGNMIAGGSGKTPFVRMLAIDVGEKVGILHRGYRSTIKRNGIVQSAEEGDEAYMLAKTVPQSVVIVGKNRCYSANLAIRQGVDYLLLDDGLQYRYLERDLDVVLIHKDDLLQKMEYIPNGLLRDTPSRLKNADFVVIHGLRGEEECNEARAAVRKYTAAPLIGTCYEVTNKEVIAEKIVGAFCGIAKSNHFYSFLHQLGCRIVHNETLGDHRCLADSHNFIKECLDKGAEIVVCTEKDYIKLTETKHVVPLKVAMKIVFGHDHYQELVALIRTLIQQNRGCK